MNFTEYLNLIYPKLNCTQAELCSASGLSAPVISRYLSGDRVPAVDSEHVKALALGIQQIAADKKINSDEFDYKNLILAFNKSLLQKEAVYNAFVISLNNLIDQLNVNMQSLANKLNFDVSYLYRVKAGERRPIDLDYLCESVAEYIAANKSSESDITNAAKLLSCNVEEIRNADIYRKKIFTYLTESSNTDDDIPEMSGFLNKMEEFNLDEYIKVIHFDELKIPKVPYQFPSSKYYYGIKDMRKAELDFLKTTVLGKSNDSVFMCSYMPMQEMAEDMDFGKKWMFGIAMMIKKGLHLNVIHNLDRPMHELMLGFEAWIPIYMTGQVSPYHIPDYNSDVFHQINYCSGSAALMGECIDGFYSDGRYYVTNNKNEISYFRKKADALLNKAKPLMDIYTVETRGKFKSFIKKSTSTKGNRRVISSSLPDFTIPAKVLEKHLAVLSVKEREEILTYINNTEAIALEIMSDNTLTYDICELTREEYEKNPVTLNFPAIFSDFASTLSYDEYMEHLNATKEYANTHSNFKLNYVETIPFNNIKITIISGKYFIISKAKSPNIHFVIYHKKMLAGMENFYVAYKDCEKSL